MTSSYSANSLLFGGCASENNPDYLNYAGYFKDSTGSYIRLGKLDMVNKKHIEVFDGSSSDFDTTSGLTGSFECVVKSNGNDRVILAAQNF